MGDITLLSLSERKKQNKNYGDYEVVINSNRPITLRVEIVAIFLKPRYLTAGKPFVISFFFFCIENMPW